MRVENWIERACIVRWCQKLRDLTGCSGQEIAARREMLLEFCALQNLSPDGLLERCRERSKLDFYLQAAGGTSATLIVQSFLIHNGINVFGELVCLPAGEA